MASRDALAGVLTRITGALPSSVVTRKLGAAGVPAFPRVPGRKRPLTEHSFHDDDSTTDQARWRRGGGSIRTRTSASRPAHPLAWSWWMSTTAPSMATAHSRARTVPGSFWGGNSS